MQICSLIPNLHKMLFLFDSHKFKGKKLWCSTVTQRLHPSPPSAQSPRSKKRTQPRAIRKMQEESGGQGTDDNLPREWESLYLRFRCRVSKPLDLPTNMLRKKCTGLIDSSSHWRHILDKKQGTPHSKCPILMYLSTRKISLLPRTP